MVISIVHHCLHEYLHHSLDQGGPRAPRRSQRQAFLRVPQHEACSRLFSMLIELSRTTHRSTVASESSNIPIPSSWARSRMRTLNPMEESVICQLPHEKGPIPSIHLSMWKCVIFHNHRENLHSPRAIPDNLQSCLVMPHGFTSYPHISSSIYRGAACITKTLNNLGEKTESYFTTVSLQSLF